MLKLTEKEKADYADLLRGSMETSPDITEDYFNILSEVQITEVYVEGRDGYQIPVWLMQPKDSATSGFLFINIHGGGFVRPHSRFDSAYCATLVKRLGCTLIDVDYRLAPEYPYPTGLNDAYDVYKWALSHAMELGVSENRIVVGGNSSGGQFSAAIPMIAQKQNDPMPAACVMLYPVCSINTIEDLTEEIDLSDVANRGRLYNLLYCTKDSDFDDSCVSLLKATPEELKQFPDLILATGGLDPLAADAETFARNVASASGSRVVMKRFLNSRHGFLNRCMGSEWKQGREYVFREIEYLMQQNGQ